MAFDVEGDDGAPPGGQRGLSLDDELNGPYTDFYTYDDQDRPLNHDYVPVGGYGALIDALRSALLDRSPPVDIRLGAHGEVVSVSHMAEGASCAEEESIAVGTRDGQTIQGSHVLLTVSLGVLQHNHLAFSPSLPAERNATLEGMAMGVLDRVLLRWDTPFWPTTASGFGWVAVGNRTFEAGDLPVALNSAVDSTELGGINDRLCCGAYEERTSLAHSANDPTVTLENLGALAHRRGHKFSVHLIIRGIDLGGHPTLHV